MVNRKLEIDEELSKLLGYYIAEGCYSKDEGTNSQVRISCTEPQVKDFCSEQIRKRFNSKVHQEEQEIRTADRLTHTIFKIILNLPRTAKQKSIPDYVKDKIREAYSKHLDE